MEDHTELENMTREELLTKLKSITFAVFMTILPSEMCLEIETMTAEGTGYEWIGYNDWNVFLLRKEQKDKWTEIIHKIQEKTLQKEDLNGTDLDALLRHLDNDGKSLAINDSLSTLLADLIRIEPEINEKYYCVYEEGNLWFFTTIDDLKTLLKDEFGTANMKWEECDTEELRNWWERYAEDGDAMPVIRFDDSDE